MIILIIVNIIIIVTYQPDRPVSMSKYASFRIVLSSDKQSAPKNSDQGTQVAYCVYLQDCGNRLKMLHT